MGFDLSGVKIENTIDNTVLFHTFNNASIGHIIGDSFDGGTKITGFNINVNSISNRKIINLLLTVHTLLL
jgi:hypothetical protein